MGTEMAFVADVLCGGQSSVKIASRVSERCSDIGGIGEKCGQNLLCNLQRV